MKKIIMLLLILFSNTLARADVGSLTATPGHNKIVLNWANDNLDTVTLIRKIWDYPATITNGTIVYSGTETTYIDLDVTNGIPYYYTAFDSVGNFSRAIATPRIDISPPDAPGTVTEGLTDIDFNDTGTYTVYWGTSTDEQSEVIEYAVQERVGTEGTWGTLSTTTSLYYHILGKTAGKVYYYRVRAKNEAELWGTWSNTSDGIRVVNKIVELPATHTIRYGQINIDIPANAFVGSVTFTISQISPLIDFASSTPKMNAVLPPYYELLAFDTDTKEVQPVGSLTLIFSYTPHPLGTDTDYRIYQLEDNFWKSLGTPTIIPEGKLIMIEVDSLSTYVVGWPEISLASIDSFTATAGNNRQMTLGWESPVHPRVTEVIIVKNTGTYATTPTEGTQIYRGTLTTHTETLLTPNTTYYYTAFSSDGGANYSSPVFTQGVATDTTPPGLVGSFTVKAESKKIVLIWNNPADKDFVRTEIIRDLHHFPETVIDGTKIYHGKGTSTTDIDVKLGQVYYYTAFSYDGINYSQATISVQGSVTLTKDDSPPSTIGTITEGYGITDGDRDVSNTGNYLVCWSAVTDTESGIANYEIQERKNSNNFETVSNNITTNYYLITGRELGSIYYYRVRAKNGAGIWGSWSTTSDGIRVVTSYFYLPGAISFATGTEKIEVDAPANAFEGTTTFTITKLSSFNLALATPKIKKPISSAWQLLAINPDNNEEMPTKTLTIFITYPDTGLSQDDEMRLKIYCLNENNNRWEMIPESQTISTEDNIIKATITTLSTFVVALPSFSAATLGDVKVYPNPFKPSKGHDKITFEGLKNDVQIRIYKITGELVYENDYPSTNGYEYWSVTNIHGEPLASGVYIYVIEGSGEKAMGKIAIIR